MDRSESLNAKFSRIYLPSYCLRGGEGLGGLVKMGATLLYLSEAMDLLLLFLERVRGLMLRFTAEVRVLAFYLERDS
jgi:hypothetical protein